MADKEHAVAQLMSVTGCSPEQAQFFLDANDWNLEAATSSYFENAESAQEPAAEQADEGPFQAGGPFQGSSEQSAAGSSSSSAQRTGGSGTRVKTFKDLIAGNTSDSDSSEDDQTFFAGGEKSGLMMQGGPKADHLVKDILEKAAKSGQAPEELQPNNRPNFFGGAGYRLGSEEEPASSGPSLPAVQNEQRRPLEPVERHLTFWRNGFSIDDGPLRSYQDPESQEFLRAINSGRAPTHLLNVNYDQPVEVKVTRNLDQDYVPPPKKPAIAFSGTGQRLGGITSDAEGSGSHSIPGAFPLQSNQSTAAPSRVPAPTAPALSVDDSQPVTSVQIRLADGTRLVIKLNHTHTIGDLRNFVNASRPDMSSRRWVLQTSYPVNELSDDKATVKDAGLINAVIVQRWV